MPEKDDNYCDQEEIAANAPIRHQVAKWNQQPFLGELLDSLPVMTLILNSDRQILFANRPLLEYFSIVSLDVVVGLRPGEMARCRFSLHAKGGCGHSQQCALCGALESILKSQRSARPSEHPTLLPLESGKTLQFRTHAAPLRMDPWNFTLVSFTDMSHENRRSVLENFFFQDITGMAGAINAYARLIRGKELPESSSSYASKIETLSARLHDDIRAQQEILASEMNELKVTREAISSNDLFENIRDLYRHQELLKNRYLDFDENDRIVFFNDTVLVTRILGNMVKNALEASSPGEKVKLSCEYGPLGVRFRVHNSGFMETAVKSRVFTPNFSTKGPGRGLGTYSMKLIGENYLKGKISFESSEETGTCFLFDLPLDIESQETAE